MFRTSFAALFLCVASVTFGAAVVFGASVGCSRTSDAPSPTGSATVPLAASALPKEKGGRPASSTAIDFVAGFDGCTLSHRGVLLDLGDPTMRARIATTTSKTPGFEVREHEGATWASLSERSIALSFVSPGEPKADAGVVVEARVRGGAAKSLSLYLNGKALGTLPLAKGEVKVVSMRAPSVALARGANELLVRVIGGARATHDNLVEIDWIRVGPADGEAPYSAPTRGDALTSVSIGGVARRGLSLRAPGSARCSGFVPNGSILEGQVGVSGGEAEAEVRVLTDRAEPRVIGSFRLGGEGAPAWQPVSLPLGDVGTLAAVELVAKSSTKGARIVFAEPRVVSTLASSPEQLPKSRGVIVVVLGSVAPKTLPPYGGSMAMTELGQLATGGTVFEAHRATSSFANGALASMLTGLGPRAHEVTQHEASLVPSAFTIAEAARQAGIVTAMFTANPTTSAAFGFARGWETFGARSPADDAPATTVFEDVEHWLDVHKDQRFLVVVHARGGHPPWEVTADELKDMPPANYTGSLDPKHAAEMLSKVRRGPTRHFTDADRERALAFHAKSLLAHDVALGKLVARVRALGRDADTTWIITGDVGVDAAAHAPFLEDDTLDENALAIPLIVRSPGTPTRARVSSPTSSVDVARTVLEAFGLEPPPQLRGESLWPAAQRGDQGLERPRVATTASRYSARLASFVLSGVKGHDGKMCNLSLEPNCVSDVRVTHPLAAELMHAIVVAEVEPAGEAKPTVHVTPDAATSAALRAWGVVGDGAGR